MTELLTYGQIRRRKETIIPVSEGHLEIMINGFPGVRRTLAHLQEGTKLTGNEYAAVVASTLPKDPKAHATDKDWMRKNLDRLVDVDVGADNCVEEPDIFSHDVTTRKETRSHFYLPIFSLHSHPGECVPSPADIRVAKQGYADEILLKGQDYTLLNSRIYGIIGSTGHVFLFQYTGADKKFEEVNGKYKKIFRGAEQCASELEAAEFISERIQPAFRSLVIGKKRKGFSRADIRKIGETFSYEVRIFRR